jgi:GT2 family glycosyltransferase
VTAVRTSVVVPTHRRPELLERCLRALIAQECHPSAYEVIVVDDADCAETRHTVKRLRTAAEAGPEIRYVLSSGRGPAAARNAGWRHARGELIAFTDDDCMPDPSWLGEGLSVFVDGVTAASGRTIVPISPRPTDYERNAAHLAESEFVTANCFYRRDALERVGGFDERFTLAWREDTDLHFRLIREGVKLVHVPEAVVVHPVRKAPWGVSVGQQRKSYFNALLYRKHPDLYRARVQKSPPWRYYATTLALAVAAFAGITGQRRAAGLGVAAWLGFSAQFCWLRLRGTARTPSHVLEMVITSLLIPPLSVYWRLRGALRFRTFFL